MTDTSTSDLEVGAADVECGGRRWVALADVDAGRAGRYLEVPGPVAIVSGAGVLEAMPVHPLRGAAHPLRGGLRCESWVRC